MRHLYRNSSDNSIETAPKLIGAVSLGQGLRNASLYGGRRRVSSSVSEMASACLVNKRAMMLMHSYLTIDPKDISELGDAEFRELVARLAIAEVSATGQSSAGVTFGGDQRAADGGIDVRVDVAAATLEGGYIPAAKTGFQVKAEAFGPADIIKEMMPGGSLRASIADLSARGGAYIIASSKTSVADKGLRTRVATMQACLEPTGDNLKVDFYDSRRLANWVEQYPSLVAWVRARSRRGSTGWQPYGPWAYGERDTEAEYLLDDRARIFAPGSNEPVTAEEAIASLRRQLNAPKSCIRLTGLSGVGKTRLAQALFDERVVGEHSALNKSAVLYADSGDEPTPTPSQLVDVLISRGDRAIVVVDNCNSDQHRRLTEKVSKSERLSLITVEYDIRDDVPEGTECYRLEPSSDKIIKAIISTKCPHLTAQDIETISEFSGGNSRVALALAHTATKGGQLANLKDETLFQRLFQQNSEPNEELQRVAEICSLLFSFEAEATEGDEAELPILAGLADVSVIRLVAHLGELKRRGLLQQRGRWRAILPHAVANRLAGRALQNIARPILLRVLVHDASERMARSFSRRLGMLIDVPEAEDIARHLLAEGGVLGSVTSLNALGIEMLRNVAPLVPGNVLATIERAADDEQFAASYSREISTLIPIINSIAYEPIWFERCVVTLTRFAEADREGRFDHSASDALGSLFYARYSGTLSDPSIRQQAIDRLFTSESSHHQHAALIALRAALKTDNFDTRYAFDFGGRSRGYGWHPSNRADVERWFGLFLAMSHDIGTSSSPHAVTVRSIVAQKFAGLWWRAHMFQELEKIASAYIAIDGWPAGWQGVRQAIAFAPADQVESEHARRLHALLAQVAPSNLTQEVRATVLEGSSSIDMRIATGRDASQFHEKYAAWNDHLFKLGQRLAFNPAGRSELARDLLITRDKDPWEFGRGFGSALDNPVGYMTELRAQIPSIEPGKLSLRFVSAMLVGTPPDHHPQLSEYMDFCIGDEIWGPHFPYLQASLRLDAVSVERLVRSARLGLVHPSAFTVLGGRVTDTLTVDDIGKIVTAVCDMDQGAIWMTDVLSMCAHLAGEKSEAYRSELRKVCRRFISRFDWTEDNSREWHVEQISDFGFADEAPEGDLAELVGRLRDRVKSYGAYKVRGVLSALFKNHATAVLNALFVPDEDGKYRTATAFASGSHFGFGSAPINAAPVGQVIDWCAADRETRLAFIIESCTAFAPASDHETPTDWSELAYALIEHSNDRIGTFKLLADKCNPMSGSGSMATAVRARMQLLHLLPTRFPEIPEADYHAAMARLEAAAKQYERWETENNRRIDETFE